MIYLDEEFRAYAEQDTEITRMPWDDVEGFFVGKCEAFIEGHRVVPEGEEWIRDDGKVFTGLMISPIVNPIILQSVQATADKQTIANLDAEVLELANQNALHVQQKAIDDATIAALDAEVVDLTYENILLELGV